MKIILIRHGETDANVSGTIQGQTESNLTNSGKEQARRAGERLRDERIDIAYVSNLTRARETAEIILKSHSETKVIVTSELTERSYGVLEGLHKDDALERINDSGILFHEYKPENGESLPEARERIVAFYHKLLEKHSHETILIVSHGALLSTLYTYLHGKELGEYRAHHPENTAVTIIEIDDDKKHTVHVLNDISHLK